VASTRRRSFQDEDYWGKPVPGFGDAAARLLIVGLAPAAHGANRTGRMFTGDRSGDWLYGALHRAGFSNRAESVGRGDGLVLRDAWVTAPVRCAPPHNRPTAEERDRCLPWLDEELSRLPNVRVVVCLGGFAWDVMWRIYGSGAKVKFGHGVLHRGDTLLLGSYHPSQQNTFTGRLTEEMFDRVFSIARAELSGLG
jgi:uracil-DNA glycosylase family 4